jgi:dihydropteroate synthase
MSNAPDSARAPVPVPVRALRPTDRTAVMGVVNVTPDSFYEGGRHATPEAAVLHARRLIAEGADVLDVGGESTRPGATAVDAEAERRRVVPVIAALRAETRLPLSIDTMKASVAAAALDAGADLVNDVSAGRFDPAMLPLVAARGAGIVLMHMQGTPATMQVAPAYADVVAEVAAFLAARAAAARAAGVRADRIWLDPGIGFGKRLEHNVTLLAHLGMLVDLGYPILVGVSRKGFLGTVTRTGDLPADRLVASTAAAALAVANGAHVVRAHDVAATLRSVRMADAIVAARRDPRC